MNEDDRKFDEESTNRVLKNMLGEDSLDFIAEMVRDGFSIIPNPYSDKVILCILNLLYGEDNENVDKLIRDHELFIEDQTIVDLTIFNRWRREELLTILNSIKDACSKTIYKAHVDTTIAITNIVPNNEIN